jgi:hypothetical protein
MPSPESPTKRMTTLSSSSTGRAGVPRSPPVAAVAADANMTPPATRMTGLYPTSNSDYNLSTNNLSSTFFDLDQIRRK